MFGTSSTPAKPLFGATSTSQPSSGGLFGATSTAGGLFGSSTSTASAPATGSLFGASTAASSGGLFGSTTTTTTTAGTGLFGATTTTASSGTPSLFGSTATPASTAATSTPSLFGNTAAAPAKPSLFGATSTSTTSATSGGLFGAKPAATTTTTASGLGGSTGLFGSTTATSQPTSTLGLGGQKPSSGFATSTTTSTSLATGEKDASKDSEIPGSNEIRTLIPVLEEKLKKNREIMEQIDNMTVDNTTPIEELIDKARSWINEVRRNVREANDMSTYSGNLVAEDKKLLDTAKRLNDASSTSNQTTLNNTIKRHLFELTDNYDNQMGQMQNRVEGIRTKFERLINGQPALSMEELDELFKRCDKSYAAAQYHIHETGREIEAVKNSLIQQGYTHLRKSYQPYQAPTKTNEGAEFFPSHSSLAIIGNALKAPSASTTGIGTGTGLFGSNTGGSSLFGSTGASKPAFSGGSLFGNLSNPATSTTGTSLFGAKPGTTTASTVTNNSSGLLFSMKK